MKSERATTYRSWDPDSCSGLASKAYKLYEAFRSNLPPSVGIWDAAGKLDLALIAKLARR